MTQTPVTITYTLEDTLKEINQKLGKIQDDVTEVKIGQVRLENELKGEIKALDVKLTGEIKTLDAKLTGEIKTLDAKVEGIGKRLDTQEFINRAVVAGFVLAVGAAVTKILFPNWLA